jgi:hypothetical protein
VLPRTGRDPAAAVALLEDLADRALRSGFEPVICLEAPEAVEVPRGLLRADGRSIYQRHGGVRYATRAQLAMEERLVAQASAGAAPRLNRADAARALGAELARLEDTLAGRAQELQDHHPERTGLTADQSAARLRSAWPKNTGPRWLWSATPGNCRPSRTAAPGPCSPPNLDTSISPTRSGSAPRGNRKPSLRLRIGDTSVLAEYDQHGRITGGEPEQMIEAAATAFAANYPGASAVAWATYH